VHTRPLQPADIAKPRQHDVAGALRVHAARDELARAHLDMEGDLFVDLVVDVHAPEP
jgi:hypothetical protein